MAKAGEEERPSWNFYFFFRAAFGIFLPSSKVHGVFLCSQVISSIGQDTSVNEQAQSRAFLASHSEGRRQSDTRKKKKFPFGRLANVMQIRFTDLYFNILYIFSILLDLLDTKERGRGTNAGPRKAFRAIQDPALLSCAPRVAPPSCSQLPPDLRSRFWPLLRVSDRNLCSWREKSLAAAAAAISQLLWPCRDGVGDFMGRK